MTELTEIAVRTVLNLGAELHLSECNPETTSQDAVEKMRQENAHVYLGASSAKQVLAAKPLVISDTGFYLTTKYLETGDNWLQGACEITTSGITLLRQISPSFPVINLNDTTLKSTIENFHGVGDGLLELLPQVSEKDFAGRKVVVVGYGQVGAGCAHYLQKAGALVSVVEKDSIRALEAHFDGFAVQSLGEALPASELVVTATGQANLLSSKEWDLCLDGALIVNVGHFANELDIAALEKMSHRKKLNQTTEEFCFSAAKGLNTYKNGGKKIYIATSGHPANVVLLTGSPQPTFIHLTTEILALAYLAELCQKGHRLPPGENMLPRHIEQTAADLALKSLNLSHNQPNLMNEKWQNHDRDLESRAQTC